MSPAWKFFECEWLNLSTIEQRWIKRFEKTCLSRIQMEQMKKISTFNVESHKNFLFVNGVLPENGIFCWPYEWCFTEIFTNIIPPCKRMPETNTLAYFPIPRGKEMFFDKDPICDFVNFFCSSLMIWQNKLESMFMKSF